MKNRLLPAFVSGMVIAMAAQTQAQEINPVSANQVSDLKQDVIPGPRSCFWSRGPVSGDPYMNVAYPDANVYYWAATFTIPEGAKLDLKGEFAHSRYMSFISYDGAGKPIESVADYLIQPEKNSGNPFVYGQERNPSQRQYSLNISTTPVASARKIGQIGQPQSVSKLYAPAYGKKQQTIIYRIYLPDNGASITGGVDLPNPQVTLADGRVVSGDQACGQLKSNQRLQLSIAALSIPANDYRKLVTQPGKPDTWPAQNPAKWFIQLDRESLLGMFTGKINENARRSEGGFYPNLDNQYLRTIVNRKYGKVFMLRGKAPSVAKTFNNKGVFKQGDLRYWSICSNQGFANTRVNDCLFDEEIPVDENGYYTVAVSRAADRPRNARPECGIGWLPMAEDGDGVADPDMTVVQIRHMLASNSFKNTFANVEQQKDLESVLGEYLPKTNYVMPNLLEISMPCMK